MRISIADNCSLKFCGDLKKHWEDAGHEVKYEHGASEILAQWTDIYHIDWVDSNINYLFNWYKENPAAKKPKFVVRAIDIDVWTRGVRSQELVDFVDYWVCIAPHIQEYLLKERDDTTGNLIDWKGKLHLIKPGVDLEKFTPKTKKTDGFQLGMNLGDMWWAKNHMAGLDIFTTLYREDNRWRLHIRGQHEGGQYWPIMYEHYIESRGIKDVVTLYPYQTDMNLWYENIDVLLHPSMKEAFCYAVAEAMAKKIKVVCNEFYGSTRIWPDWILYQTHDEAIRKIKEPPMTQQEYRKYIEQNYPNQKMFAEFDKLLGI